jgi:hypothetical protein
VHIGVLRPERWLPGAGFGGNVLQLEGFEFGLRLHCWCLSLGSAGLGRPVLGCSGEELREITKVFGVNAALDELLGPVDAKLEPVREANVRQIVGRDKEGNCLMEVGASVITCDDRAAHGRGERSGKAIDQRIHRAMAAEIERIATVERGREEVVDSPVWIFIGGEEEMNVGVVLVETGIVRAGACGDFEEKGVQAAVRVDILKSVRRCTWLLMGEILAPAS